MANDKHLEEQVRRLEALAPAFGRATPDILAIGSRARTGDFRGVLQNTRLVVETLLRAIYAKKKQTPGKQTLEQLLSKLTGELPTNIQVHTRTIQAWGNVGAHDHSEDLFGDSVQFSRDEALASLNSLIVVLEWYRDFHLADGSLPSVPASPAGSDSVSGRYARPETMSSVAPGPKRGNTKAIVIAGGLLLVAGGGAVALQMRSGPPAMDLAALDKLYVASKIPRPLAACRTKSAPEAAAIEDAMKRLAGGRAKSGRPDDHEARKRLEDFTERTPSVELWAILARARLYSGAASERVLSAIDRAVNACPDWAEPHNLKGNLHLLEGDLDAAKKAYLRAAKADPSYLAPRFNLGLVLLKSGATKEALAEFDVVLAQDPKFDAAYAARGRGRLLSQDVDGAIADLEEALRRNAKDGPTAMVLGQALRQKGEAEKANVYFCQAKRLEVPGAESLCEE